MERETLQPPAGSEVVRAALAGRFCPHRKKINISAALVGQRLGTKEVDEGIWLVRFLRGDFG
jgi:hypothetical protein